MSSPHLQDDEHGQLQLVMWLPGHLVYDVVQPPSPPSGAGHQLSRLPTIPAACSSWLACAAPWGGAVASKKGCLASREHLSSQRIGINSAPGGGSVFIQGLANITADQAAVGTLLCYAQQLQCSRGC